MATDQGQAVSAKSAKSAKMHYGTKECQKCHNPLGYGTGTTGQLALAIPEQNNVVEIDGADLPAFIAEQRKQGRVCLVMAVIGTARYRLTMANAKAWPAHALPPVARSDCTGEKEQPRPARRPGARQEISLSQSLPAGDSEVLKPDMCQLFDSRHTSE